MKSEYPVHFCFGMAPDFGGKPFSFVHFLSVILARKMTNSRVIYWHHHYLPTGKWWDVAREHLTLIKCDLPHNVFGNRIEHPAHMADIIRLRALSEFGGLYLDLDVLLLQDPSRFSECDCVLGLQDGSFGLCNAVVFAKKNSEFIERWLEEYRDFDCTKWDEHSVMRPLKLAFSHPHLLHIQPESTFFWPPYNSPDSVFFENAREYTARIRSGMSLSSDGGRQFVSKLVRLYFGGKTGASYIKSHDSRLSSLRNSVAIHLWESKWWNPFLLRMDPSWLRRSNSVLALRLREVLGEDELHNISRVHADI